MMITEGKGRVTKLFLMIPTLFPCSHEKLSFFKEEENGPLNSGCQSTIKISVLIFCRLNEPVPISYSFMQGERVPATNRFLTLISDRERGNNKKQLPMVTLLSDMKLVEEPGDRARAQTSPPLCILSIEPHFLLSRSLLARKPRRNDAREPVIV